jgi:ribonuclease E
MVVASAGAKHGYTVSWDASQVMFPGPVTLLGADMGEDMNLVLRALGGRRAAVEITVYRSSNVVVVRDAATGNAAVSFTDVPFSGRIREISAPKSNSSVFAAAQVAAPLPLPAPVRVVATPVAPAAPAYAAPVKALPLPSTVRVTPAYVAPAPVLVAAEPVRVTPEPARLDTAVATVKKMEPAQPLVVATSRVVTLRVAAGGQLRDAIEAILEPEWTLKWEVKDDLVANSEMSASGESVKATLNQVLPRLKLSADFYKPSKLVIVREADEALDK